jgi:hypothetical protein
MDSALVDSAGPDGDAGDGAVTDTSDSGDGSPDAPATCTTGGSAADVAVALPAPPGIAVDGDLSEWSWAQFVSITPSTWRDRAGPTVTDPDDLSARAAVLWTPTDLYLAFEVTDDTAFNESTGYYIWEGDSVQVAFDMAHDEDGAYDDTDDFELGWARTSSGTEHFRWFAPAAAGTPTDAVVITRSGNTTTYEARIGAGDLGVAAFAASDRFGFSWLVNEMDAAGSSEGFIEWTAGIGNSKDPSLFGDLLLRDCD